MGAGPGWQDTPIENGEIWGVNNTHILRNVDRIIDIHPNRLNPNEIKDKYHMYELREKMIPTYANEEIPDCPNVKKYPLKEIIEEFDSDYFSSGIDYMIALALYEGATEIHLYGVCMAKKGEYQHQKPSVEHWIGIAKGAKVKTVVHGDTTEVLRTRNGMLYGYNTPQKWIEKYHPEQIKYMEMLNSYENTVSN